MFETGMFGFPGVFLRAGEQACAVVSCRRIIGKGVTHRTSVGAIPCGRPCPLVGRYWRSLAVALVRPLVLVHLRRNYKFMAQSTQGKVQIGDLAPDFTLSDQTGAEVRLKD